MAFSRSSVKNVGLEVLDAGARDACFLPLLKVPIESPRLMRTNRAMMHYRRA
jgi:hypothetical protein